MDRSAKIAALTAQRDELIQKIANLEYDYHDPKEHVTRKRAILRELEQLHFDQYTIEGELDKLAKRSDSKLIRVIRKITRKE